MSASINHLPAKRVKVTLPRPGTAETSRIYGTCLKTAPARSPFSSGHSVRHSQHKPRSPMGCAFKTYERGAKLMTASITRPAPGSPKSAGDSAFLMCRSCADSKVPAPDPGESSCSRPQFLQELRRFVPNSPDLSGPLMHRSCAVGAIKAPSHRAPLPLVNCLPHDKLDGFIVHSSC
jgi:hypothetical protein